MSIIYIIEEKLTIEILDENDNPPIFTKKQLSTGILRSSAINTEVFDLGVSWSKY